MTRRPPRSTLFPTRRSSDLASRRNALRLGWRLHGPRDVSRVRARANDVHERRVHARSEERRVGKECRSRWSPDHEKKKEKDEEVGKGSDIREDSVTIALDMY